MSAGHLLPHQCYWNRRVAADLAKKHRKWPLGTKVRVMTPDGYLQGKVSKHWRFGEVPHGCTIDFYPLLLDFGDANGARFCHVIPFRSIKPTGDAQC